MALSALARARMLERRAIHARSGLSSSVGLIERRPHGASPKARRLASRAATMAHQVREAARHILGLVKLDRKSVTREEMALAGAARPLVRGDCVDGPRPCPWYGCRHHLGLDLRLGIDGRPSSIVYRAIESLVDSCSLDVADIGEPRTLDDIAGRLGISRERVRQLDSSAVAHAEQLHAALYPGSEED